MAVALDGSASLLGSSGLSGVVTFSNSITNGIVVLMIMVNASTFADVSTIADTAVLSWTKRGGIPDPSSNSNWIQTWYAKSSSVLSSDVITVTLTATSTFLTIHAFGISGANFSTPFDSNGSLPKTSASGNVTGLATSNANDFIFGAFRQSSTQNPTATSPFTTIIGGGFGLTCYDVVSATQSNMTITDTDANGGIGDAVQQAAGGFTPGSRRTLSSVGTRVGVRQPHGWRKTFILPSRQPLIAHRGLMLPKGFKKAA